MRSAAQGASPLSSQPANEQRAIAASQVKSSKQESKPSSPRSGSSTTAKSQAEDSQSQSPGSPPPSAAHYNGSAAQSKAVSGETTSASETTSPASQASAQDPATETVTQTPNRPANNGNAQISIVSTVEGDAAKAEETLQDDPPPGEDSEILAPPLLPKNDLATATQLEVAAFERSGSLAQDGADLYQFKVEETGIFTANLDKLSADADVQLIQDKNGNGQVDAGEIVAWEWEQGRDEESIRHFLQEGDYVVRVLNQDLSPEPTDYSITTTFQAAEADNRAFSINVVYQQSVEKLNEQARDAIERAADYWENVISHSSFDRPLNLALGIYGITTTPQSTFLAYAGPYSYRNTGETGDEQTEDRLLPTVGFAVLNNFYFDAYNANPDYLESVLRHEIGHALGLGILWDKGGNDFLDPDTGVYRAETYAGQSYGDLLGTGVATEIPLDQNSLTHWDEDTFDAELMTPRAEGIGEPLPLSPLTISSLRDLGWHVNYGAADAFSLDSNAIA